MGFDYVKYSMNNTIYGKGSGFSVEVQVISLLGSGRNFGGGCLRRNLNCVVIASAILAMFCFYLQLQNSCERHKLKIEGLNSYLTALAGINNNSKLHTNFHCLV